jgi:UDP-glucose 4-epimerase
VNADLPSKRRVLITGVSRFLGLRLAKRLERDPLIEHLVGVDLDAPPIPIDGLEFVRADIRNPLIARVLEATRADTIVHTNITSSHRRFGGRSQMKENNVIGTMQLMAAAQRAQSVRNVVVKSSTAVYGSAPADPSILSEDHAHRRVDLTGYGKDCADAETYARDFGRRRPDVHLSILRFQNVIGPTVSTSLTAYLSLPVIPTALGFDPRLQVVHETDAVEALYLALALGAKGIVNIAAQGVVYLSQAIRLLGRVQLPLVLPYARATAGAIRRAGIVDFPPDQLRLIQFGRVVDASRAERILDFSPRFTTRACIEDFRANRTRDLLPEPGSHPTWERELFEYLKRKSEEREMV